MKYVITENQLDKFISKYIGGFFGGLKEIDSPRINAKHFVNQNNDWFHNNANTYWAEFNELVVSARETFVIGIDYDTNREHGVYQRILYDYVELAIRQRCNRIVYGRTAAEIKSTVGAFPVDLTCCIKHRRNISNTLLSMIINYVKPSEYPQREPFKSEAFTKIQTQPLFENHEWNSTK
jgi:hypothetical protein